jgi:hypothetical protein
MVPKDKKILNKNSKKIQKNPKKQRKSENSKKYQFFLSWIECSAPRKELINYFDFEIIATRYKQWLLFVETHWNRYLLVPF